MVDVTVRDITMFEAGVEQGQLERANQIAELEAEIERLKVNMRALSDAAEDGSRAHVHLDSLGIPHMRGDTALSLIERIEALEAENVKLREDIKHIAEIGLSFANEVARLRSAALHTGGE